MESVQIETERVRNLTPAAAPSLPIVSLAWAAVCYVGIRGITALASGVTAEALAVTLLSAMALVYLAVLVARS